MSIERITYITYTCAPVEPGSCTPGCVKVAKPGSTAPRLRFLPNAPSCASEPVKKHSYVVTGFHEYNRACATEDV